MEPSPLPDGLAHGKVRSLEVQLPEDKCRVLFEYYIEYGDQGVVRYRFIDPSGGVEVGYLPIKALLVLVDQFRKDVTSSNNQNAENN